MYTTQFQTIQPDYIDEEIDLKPEKSLSFSIKKRQLSDNLVGNKKSSFNLSSFHEASFSFNLKNLTEAQKNTFLDIYVNEYKANGRGKTLVYNHPVYNEKFVCKFLSVLNDSFDRNERYEHRSISLAIIGTDRNLMSMSTWSDGEIAATGFSSIISASADLTYDSILDYDDIIDYDEIL